MNINNNSSIAFNGLRYKGEDDTNPTKTSKSFDTNLIQNALSCEDLINDGLANANVKKDGENVRVTFLSQSNDKIYTTVLINPDNDRYITFITKSPEEGKPNSGEKVVVDSMEFSINQFYDLYNKIKGMFRK